uniref:Sushi domain-containing protein n=1 Tax=Pundamilia nyererei TaxID=303518 RepID=A0A3B4FM24_9CICH
IIVSIQEAKTRQSLIHTHSFMRLYLMSLLWLPEVDCGSPPAVPHSRLLWNKSTRMGTEVVYQCNSGYHNVGKRNVSICTAAGQWAGPSILCGNPPVIEFTGQVWSYNSTPGSTVLYFCKDGFYNKGGNNVSTCQENGHWTSPTLSCQGNQTMDCFLMKKNHFSVHLSLWPKEILMQVNKAEKPPKRKTFHNTQINNRYW